MTIVRLRRTARFAALPNAIWEDDRLSIEAKGVLGYLLSRPANWQVRLQQVGKKLGLGKDRSQRIFRELNQAGYASREQPRLRNGAFGPFEYVIRDEAEGCVAVLPQPDLPAPAEPAPAKPAPVNQAAYINKTESTKTEFTKTEANIQDTRGAPARGQSAFTQVSKALAAAFYGALGFQSPLHVPPEFAGVEWRAVQWEQAGWTVDLIDTEARRIARYSPLKPLSYFEKVFATSFAKRQAPLPVVEIRPAEAITVTRHERPSGNIIQAADRLVETIRHFDDGPRGPDQVCGGAGEASVRLLPKR